MFGVYYANCLSLRCGNGVTTAPKIQKNIDFNKFKIMSKTREQTKKQLRRMLSMAFSLDAAMDAFLADMVEEDGEGNFNLIDQYDEDAFILMGGFHEQIQNMTCDLYRILLNRYECNKDDDDE